MSSRRDHNAHYGRSRQNHNHSAISAAMASRSTKEKILFHDDIPPFANFDEVDTRIRRRTSSPQKKNSADSQKNTSIGNNAQQPNGSSSRVKASKGFYDPEDVASSKWAKMQAVEIAENQSAKRGEAVKTNVRPPTSAGFLRSESVNSRQRHKSLTHATRSNNVNEPNDNPNNSSRLQDHSRKKPIINSQKSSSANQSKLKLSEEDVNSMEFFSQKKYVFQNPSRLVSYRLFDFKARAVFEKKNLISVAELQEYGRVRNGGNKQNKLSPSFEHLEILEAINNSALTRQLCWSPAVSLDADPFFEGFTGDLDDREQSNVHNGGSRMDRHQLLLAQKRKQSAAKRAGKFRRMDPVTYIKNTLPDHEPLLTSKRMRLPMRRDVGFPGATEEEITQKEIEIMKEAQLEEISPRLVVLLNSDDLGSPPDLKIDRYSNNSIDSPTLNVDCKLRGAPFASEALKFICQNKSVVREKAVSNLMNGRSKSNLPKPNLFSIFAPPLDATSSSSEIWRARSCSDHPAGLLHSLVVPRDVTFGVGKIEPLVCSLSLYCLPDQSSAETILIGKISEDFYFPAGEWNDMLDETASKMLSKEFGIDNPPSSQKSLKKAILSYDPSALPPSTGKNSIYIFLQVHKVAHIDADEVYIDNTNKSTGSQFMGFPRRGSSGSLHNRNETNTIQRVSRALDNFGTQFLTPFCFGLLPLSANNYHWPQGESQKMKLFSYDEINESESKFIERLASIARDLCEYSSSSGPNLSENPTDLDSIGSQSSFESGTLPKTAQKMQKIKKHGLKVKKNRGLKPAIPQSSVDVGKLVGMKLIDGHALFFTSMLGNDFSQSLLFNHSEDEVREGPRLLVDSSGDCAIMVNPEQRSNSSWKRSSLIRLPPSKLPSGYANSSEIREVLYVPPTNNHSVGLYAQTHGVYYNYLYLYPQKITMDNFEAPFKNRSCSVRIRLVRQVVTTDGSKSYIPEVAIYNPSLDGASIVEAIYTKLHLNSMSNKSTNIFTEGVYLRDEIKVRLPEILDGSHFIQFSLYAIEVECSIVKHSGGLIQNFVAESLIPLSSTSAKDPFSQTKVSTVIPDGLHRIKLSNYQLQVQSRLCSNIHTSDPAVALAFRNCAEEIATQGNDKIIPFSNYLSIASKESIAHHFHSLLFMHFRYIINHGNINFDTGSMRATNTRDTFFALEKIRSLIEMIDKVKQKSSIEEFVDDSVKKMFKSAFDAFDDDHFYHGIDNERKNRILKPQTAGFSNDSLEISERRESPTPPRQHGKSKPYKPDEQNIGNYTSYPLSISIASENRNKRLQRVYSSLNGSSPLNRTAYGASKIDRMKAEAELYESREFVSELIDDDETVVTSATWQSQGRLMSSARNSFTNPLQGQSNRNRITENILSGQDQLKDDLVAEEVLETPFEKAKDFARRMNTAAKVFVSPCVAPIVNDGGSSSPVRKKLGSSKGIRDLQNANPRVQKLRSQFYKSSKVKHTIYEGSDDESDNISSASNKYSVLPKMTSTVQLRGVAINSPYKIRFSLSRSIETKNQAPFLYEIIFALWLHSFSQKKDSNEEGEVKTGIDPQAFVRNMDFFLPLCLKSLALRCCDKLRIDIVPSVVLDISHVQVLEHLVAHIAVSLVQRAVERSKGCGEQTLSRTLLDSDEILDFLIGLLSIVHPAQVSYLISTYFQKLRLSEDGRFMNLRGCRHLRIRAVERFASLPRFVALNYPFRYECDNRHRNEQTLSWTNHVLAEMPKSISRSIFDEKLPKRHWLAETLLNESFEICFLSCEAIVSGSQVVTTKPNSPKKKQSAMRQRVPLTNEQLQYHKSISYHAITVVYELLIRKHATNEQCQSKEALSRIAGMFLSPIVDNTLDAVHCLSKMDPRDKVRSTWVLCFAYVLQEAPEVAIRHHLMLLCNKSKSEHSQSRFLKALKICASTFEGFSSKEFSARLSPWLIQESFNTISAATIVLVDECCDILSSRSSYDLVSMIEGVLNVLLQIISTPLSSVTLLRSLGASSHVLNKVGAEKFITATGDNLQHWGRMIFTLMNSTSLSVRSMAVDLTVSIFGSLYKEGGNIDGIAHVFITILPEVVGREIALYGESRQLKRMTCIERSMWPLRRALADIEDTDPIDDDRIDSSLLPFIQKFCRVCQATIDSVLVELRLVGDECIIMGSTVEISMGEVSTGYYDGHKYPLSWIFDADEESLFEVADFFTPEAGPFQKLRWLLTLKKLHEFKGQWVEAAETLILCARTAADAIPHINDVWRPSYYSEWKKSEALSAFSQNFLEPSSLQKKMALLQSKNNLNTLPALTTMSLCEMLVFAAKESVKLYEKEGEMISLSYSRLQEVLKIVMRVVEEQIEKSSRNVFRRGVKHHKQKIAEDIFALRKVSASINELVAKLAEQMSLITVCAESALSMASFANMFGKQGERIVQPGAVYVRIVLLGKKPKRFQESTAIPTFLDWGSVSICRVPRIVISESLKKAKGSGDAFQDSVRHEICHAFAEPLIHALRKELHLKNLEFTSDIPSDPIGIAKGEKSYLVVTPVVVREVNQQNELQSKRFQVRKALSGPQNLDYITDITVAKYFPCALSRQPSLVTAEFTSNGTLL